MAKERSGKRASELRKRAEKILTEDPQAIRTIEPADIQKLIHELNAHQIELEMQNAELRRVQLELQETRDKYLNLYDLAPTGYFTLDQSSLIADVNLAGRELLGSEKHRLIGAQFTASISADSQDAFYFHYREVLKTGIKGNCELNMLKADGTTFYAQLISIAIAEKDGNISHYRTAVIDITERKRAEEALKQSEVKYRTLVGRLRDGVYQSDLQGNYVTLNEAGAKIFGFDSPEQVIGKYKTIDLYHYLSNRAKIVDELKRTGSFIGEVQAKRRDGTTIWLDVNNNVILDEKGDTVGYEGTFGDITERKKMQEQLMAQDRLASIGQLVSGVAHEINNPLTGVIGFSELLLKRDLPDDVKADLKVVNDEAMRTAIIVKNLLTFARKQPEGKAPVDINEQIQKVLDLRAHEQSVNNILVATCFASDLPQIMGNASQLQQVFFNIVINAEFFMLEAHQKGNLTITTERIGDSVRASFADDGPGISKENMTHLFSPFYTTKEVGKGTGLGLSICHGIITEHGGKIYADSEVGKGATFIVELPIKEEATGQEAAR